MDTKANTNVLTEEIRKKRKEIKYRRYNEDDVKVLKRIPPAYVKDIHSYFGCDTQAVAITGRNDYLLRGTLYTKNGIIVADFRGNMVACSMQCIKDVLFNNGERIFGFGGDSIVHPDYRNFGIMSKILQKLVTDGLERFNCTLYGGKIKATNHASLKTIVSLGLKKYCNWYYSSWPSAKTIIENCEKNVAEEILSTINENLYYDLNTTTITKYNDPIQCKDFLTKFYDGVDMALSDFEELTSLEYFIETYVIEKNENGVKDYASISIWDSNKIIPMKHGVSSSPLKYITLFGHSQSNTQTGKELLNTLFYHITNAYSNQEYDYFFTVTSHEQSAFHVVLSQSIFNQHDLFNSFEYGQFLLDLGSTDDFIYDLNDPNAKHPFYDPRDTGMFAIPEKKIPMKNISSSL